MKKIFVVTLFICCLFPLINFAQSDIAVPELECVNVLADGTIKLSWLDTEGGGSTVSCGATFNSFEIYKSNGNTNNFVSLTNITNPNQTTFIDVDVDNSGTTYYYYIVKHCGSSSSDFSDVISSQKPDPPFISSATVLTDNNVELTFEKSISNEAFGYLLYSLTDNGASFAVIDTIYDDNPASNFIYYQDTSARPNEGPEAYKLATFDRCFIDNPGESGSGPTNLFPHQTVFLEIENSDCVSEFNLNWTHYEGWGDDLLEYEIRAGETSLDLELISTVPATQSAFTYTLPLERNDACILIRAKHKNGVTFTNSNTVCSSLTSTNGPDYIYLRNLTVNNENEIELNWNIDVDNSIIQLNIIRGTKDSTQLGLLTELPSDLPFTSNMTYLDTKSETNKFSYFYRIQHIDECSRKKNSSYGRTMLLKAKDQFNQSNGLEWTPFEITHGTVINYVIYRRDEENGDFRIIESISDPSSVNYTDLFGDAGGSSDFCYYIEANYEIRIPGTSTTEQLSSRSNISCVQANSRIFVPNTFTPNAASNNIFKPVIVNENDADYSMMVVNRWGKVMFQTAVPAEGWDGLLDNGSLAPQGVYAYIIKMTSQTGYPLEKKGNILLLR